MLTPDLLELLAQLLQHQACTTGPFALSAQALEQCCTGVNFFREQMRKVMLACTTLKRRGFMCLGTGHMLVCCPSCALMHAGCSQC